MWGTHAKPGQLGLGRTSPRQTKRAVYVCMCEFTEQQGKKKEEWMNKERRGGLLGGFPTVLLLKKGPVVHLDHGWSLRREVEGVRVRVLPFR